jgi:hypothetical protein
MDELEAKAKAREVIRTITGVDTDPDSIDFESVGGRRRWTAFFSRDHFVAQRTLAGGTGYTLLINDDNGEVHLFGPERHRI